MGESLGQISEEHFLLASSWTNQENNCIGQSAFLERNDWTLARLGKKYAVPAPLTGKEITPKSWDKKKGRGP